MSLYIYISCVYIYIMYISCIYHVYIMYISCIYIMYISCKYHVYIMYISCIYHLYIMYISFIYHLYIMYISCISHLHRFLYIYTYTPFLSRNSQARGPSVPQASRSSWCVWSPKAVTRAPPSHLVEIPKFKFWKKILLEKKIVISMKSGYPSNSINAITPGSSFCTMGQ